MASPDTKDIKLSEVGEGLPVIELGALPKIDRLKTKHWTPA
ncbi:MAG: hypothetical protein WAN11_04215 [Syntrophobacteraceae bacterium]